MPFHLDFDAADLLRCRFAISPLWETQEAVRTLARPHRQGYHLPWMRRTRGALRGLDLAPLWLLMPETGHNSDCLNPPPIGPGATFADEIASVRATDAATVRADLALVLSSTPGAENTATGRRILDDPAGALQWLADLIEAVWQALVEPEWPRLRALLEADVAYHSRRLAEAGLEGLLGGLSPRLSWSSTEAAAGTTAESGSGSGPGSGPGSGRTAGPGARSRLTVASRGEHRRVLGGQGLVLMPSVFSWPDVVSGFDPPWQPTVIYPARGIGGLWTEAGSGTPDALVRLLGRGRADVLCALAEPAGTSALAHRLGRAPSSVSAHLTALRGAGLLVSRRYGHQVLYERTPLGIALAGVATSGELPHM